MLVIIYSSQVKERLNYVFRFTPHNKMYRVIPRILRVLTPHLQKLIDELKKY